MLSIKIGEPFVKEKKYVLETLLEDFLGFFSYQIEISETCGYLFTNSDNNKSVYFIDSFFHDKESYLDKRYLPGQPNKIIYKNTEYIFPYGDANIKYEEQQLRCHVDVFASAFFFLTRWEEIVINKKDAHGRFIDENAWLVKNMIHTRPLVNEYASLILSLINEINIFPTAKKEFTPIITHDVDLIARYDSVYKVIKALVGDVVLRKSLKSLVTTFYDVYQIYFKNKKDNYDTFDYLMSLSESIGVKSHFYFIPGEVGEHDVRYGFSEKSAKRIYKKVSDRGHIIGIHPSYDSFLNLSQVKKEIHRIESIIQSRITEGRQHYLRINLPYSWKIWDEAGLKEDSSVGFSKHFGFRSASCCKYHVFDVVNRKKLALVENPLLIMDVSSMDFNKNPLRMIAPIKEILNQVKKHSGNFTLLWHNSSFRTKAHRETYEKIICLLQTHSC